MHNEKPDKHYESLPEEEQYQASDDSYADIQEPAAPDWKQEELKPPASKWGKESACFMANPHGAQYEQGGKYPGTRTSRDPYYHRDIRGSEACQSIEDCIRRILHESLSCRELQMNQFEVIVKNSRVIITGIVPDQETFLAIEQCLYSCGLEKVDNRIQVVVSQGGHAR